MEAQETPHNQKKKKRENMGNCGGFNTDTEEGFTYASSMLGWKILFMNPARRHRGKLAEKSQINVIFFPGEVWDLWKKD